MCPVDDPACGGQLKKQIVGVDENQPGQECIANDDAAGEMVKRTEASPTSTGALRERLVLMHGDLIECLAKGGIDGGMLALLGSVGAAIAALDAITKAELGRLCRSCR
jgi:hypothetical protein